MKRIARFEKVSYEQFKNDWLDTFKGSKYDENDFLSEENILKTYEEIKLPKRATSGSAGYDFFTPLSFELLPGETLKLPTGIRSYMEEGWVLKVYPRSGYGFKFRLQLNNTVGIIDKDYYDSDNEGHMFFKLTNDTNEHKIFNIEKGTAITQGIFLEFGITEDDCATEKRNGGMGSTTKKQ